MPLSQRTLSATAAAAEIGLVPVKLRRKLTEAIKSRRFPVYLFGPTGVGKTCASGLVYQAWPLEAGWLECDETLRAVVGTRTDPETRIPWLRSDGHKGNTDLARFWALIDRCDLICIEDVGVRPATDPQREVMLEILNRRKGKATIITSNIEPNLLHKVYDGRIQSRVTEGTLIRVVGQDQRTDGQRVQEVRCD